MSARLSRLSAGVVLLAFAISRLVYATVFDVGFNATTIRRYWQIVDPELLQHRLAESIFYLHGQPPLFNLFLGTVLKLWPGRYELVFHAAYLAVGAAFALALLALMVRMRVNPRVALALTLAFTLAPTTVKYEGWLFYTYPVAALLCAAALFLHRHLGSGSLNDGVVFYGLLAAVVLTRGIYPLAWFAVTAAGVAVADPRLRRVTMRAAVIPLTAVVLFSVKQVAVFGTLGAGGAFLGPNLATRLRRQVGPTLTAELVAAHKISGILRAPQFRKISHYQKYIGTPKPTGIPILDHELKSTGAVNTNHLGYLEVSRRQMRDVAYVLAHYPVLYLKSFAGTRNYFKPSGDDPLANDLHDAPPMRKASAIWDLVVCGQWRDRGVGWTLVVVLPSLLVFAGLTLVRTLRAPPVDQPRAITLVFALWTTLYTGAITVGLSSGDYHRYRFKVDAFYVVFLGLALTALIDHLRQRWAARRAMSVPGAPARPPGKADSTRAA